MMRLIILAILIFIILRFSTLGWRFWVQSFSAGRQENIQLANRIKNHVYRLADEIGDRSVFNYKNLNEAERYISEQFKSFGYEVEFQEYTVLNKTIKNILVSRRGDGQPQEIIVVGAHYDTCFNPGADDNASAIAGLLELASFFYDKKIKRTIRFIAFVNEEPPFFKTEEMGSRSYAKAIKKKQEDIKAVIILESIGYYSDRPFSQRYPLFFGPFYPSKGNFIAVVGNTSSRRLVKKVVSDFKKETRFPIESTVTFSFIPGIDFSDHWSFWEEGYPAVMITDTAFYRNPHYHSSYDTGEKLDYGSTAEVITGLSRALIELSG